MQKFSDWITKQNSNNTVCTGDTSRTRWHRKVKNKKLDKDIGGTFNLKMSGNIKIKDEFKVPQKRS